MSTTLDGFIQCRRRPCCFHVQEVTDLLGSGFAPPKARLDMCLASLDQLHRALAIGTISAVDGTYLLLFIFRPFASTVLRGTASNITPLTLSLVHLLRHVVHKLGTPMASAPLAGPAPRPVTPQQQQQQQQALVDEYKFRSTLASQLLEDLATCAAYPRDPEAIKWLRSEYPKKNVLHYIGRSPLCPKEPLIRLSPVSMDEAPRVAGAEAPGVQALLSLVRYPQGNLADHTDSVIGLVQLLVDPGKLRLETKSVPAACSSLAFADLTPVWCRWIQPLTICSITRARSSLLADAADTASTLSGRPSDFSLEGALGATTFVLKASTTTASSSSSRLNPEVFHVVWSDQSEQYVTAPATLSRHSPSQLLLKALFSCSSSIQLSHHLAQLRTVIEDRYSSGALAVTEQEHLAEQLVQLVQVAATASGGAGLAPYSAAAAAREASVRWPCLQEAVSDLLDQLGQHLAAETTAGARQQLLEVIGSKLALLLLTCPMEYGACQWVLQLVGKLWALHSTELRWRWLGLGDNQDGVVSSLQQISSSRSGGMEGAGRDAVSARALTELPLHQQQGVLQLLLASLQKWPFDTKELPLQEVADGLVNVLAADQPSAGSQNMVAKLVLALLQQLDNGSGAVYGHSKAGRTGC